MGKTIKSKERWEVAYEDFKSGKMPKQIEKLTVELEELKRPSETLNPELVTSKEWLGTLKTGLEDLKNEVEALKNEIDPLKNELEHAKSSEEYRKAEANVKTKEQAIQGKERRIPLLEENIKQEEENIKAKEEKIQKEKEEKIKAKQEQIDKEKGKIEKNKDKIENVISTKKMLVEKTAEVLEQLEATHKLEEEKKKIENTIKALDAEREEKANKVREIEKKLNERGILDEDKAKLQVERQDILKSILENDNKYSEAINEKAEMDNKQKSTPKVEDLEKVVLKNEQLIAKCDLIGANLIKGNQMNEITPKLAHLEFKHDEKFAEKIKMARQNKKDERRTVIDRIFDEIIPEEGTEVEAPETGAPETAEPEVTTPEAPETAEPEATTPEAPETVEPETVAPETNKPARVSWFAQRFPKIAAAGHWIAEKFNEILIRNGIKKVFSDIDLEEEEERKIEDETAREETREVVAPAETRETSAPEATNSEDYEFVMEEMEKNGVDKVLTQIVEQGTNEFKRSLYNQRAAEEAERIAREAKEEEERKARVAEEYAERKAKAAEAYADKYGKNPDGTINHSSQYNHQDGIDRWE